MHPSSVLELAKNKRSGWREFVTYVGYDVASASAYAYAHVFMCVPRAPAHVTATYACVGCELALLLTFFWCFFYPPPKKKIKK